jgi:hypothetical protein
MPLKRENQPMNDEPSFASSRDPEPLGAPYAQRVSSMQLAITSARSSQGAAEAFQCLSGYAIALEDAQVIDFEQGTRLRVSGQLLHTEALERLQSHRMPHWAALIIKLNV